MSRDNPPVDLAAELRHKAESLRADGSSNNANEMLCLIALGVAELLEGRPVYDSLAMRRVKMKLEQNKSKKEVKLP